MTKVLHIFDLDGVITDTAVIHQLAWANTANALCEKYQVSNSPNFGAAYYLENIDGKSRINGLQAILDDLNININETTFKHFMTLKEDFFFNELESIQKSEIIFQDALNYLIYLNSLPNNVITLATSSLNGRKIVSKVGLLEYFDYIADGTTLIEFGLNGKPSPDIFNHVIDHYQLRHTVSTVIYEDSRSGVLAAMQSKAETVYHINRISRSDFDIPEHFNHMYKLLTVNTLERLISK